VTTSVNKDQNSHFCDKLLLYLVSYISYIHQPLDCRSLLYSHKFVFTFIASHDVCLFVSIKALVIIQKLFSGTVFPAIYAYNFSSGIRHFRICYLSWVHRCYAKNMNLSSKLRFFGKRSFLVVRVNSIMRLRSSCTE